MSANTKLLEKKVKFSIFTITFLSLGILCYSSIAKATTFNGPSDLSSQEYKDLTINGPSNLNKIKADILTVNGPLNFKQLKVVGDTEISGPTSGDEGEFANVVIHGTFWGSKIKMENLHVNGDVTIEDFKINGNVDINGPLKAKNGSFNNINTVHTPVALYNVTVNNINVKKDSDSKIASNAEDNGKNKEIKLAGDTIVSGNITFESGDGVVFIRDKTAQLKGKIIGGTLKNNE